VDTARKSSSKINASSVALVEEERGGEKEKRERRGRESEYMMFFSYGFFREDKF
jgi:hypothetical protein